jgi:uncharacterized protein YbbC (DUF1343 family)
MDMTMAIVQTGLENLIASPPAILSGRRLGLLCNPASVDGQLRHGCKLINDRFPGQLTALFSPQHGFFSEKQDNMVESDDMRDPALNIPVFSLYGKTRIPTADMFSHLDILLIDLQDVGTRVYTFIYTVSYCLEAARRFGKKVLILDRPNPINGRSVEGNILKPEWASFVGRYEIPMRHGLTMAELALLLNDHFKIDCDLSVVPMTGWRRDMFFADTGLYWVPPSPIFRPPHRRLYTRVRSYGRAPMSPKEGGPACPLRFLVHPTSIRIESCHLLAVCNRQVRSCGRPHSNRWPINGKVNCVGDFRFKSPIPTHSGRTI